MEIFVFFFGILVVLVALFLAWHESVAGRARRDLPPREEVDALLAEIQLVVEEAEARLEEKLKEVRGAEARLTALLAQAVTPPPPEGQTGGEMAAETPAGTAAPANISVAKGVKAAKEAGVRGKPAAKEKEDGIHTRVWRLAEQGWSEERIAQEVGRGKGEIELILNLRRFAQRQALGGKGGQADAK